MIADTVPWLVRTGPSLVLPGSSRPRLSREHQHHGVTLVKMSPELDTGDILAQQSLPIAPDDTRLTLYKKLYDLGAQLAVEYLPKIVKGEIVPQPQPAGNYFFARVVTRQDGFVPWKEFEDLLKNNPQALDQKLRALAGWPGVWTRLPEPAAQGAGGQATTPQGKRLKLIALKPEAIVQLEGKKPVPFKQFLSAYFPARGEA